MLLLFGDDDPDVIYLWIDAICIDQTKDDEKANQIPLMGDIYSQAESVIIWLGNDSKYLRTFVWMHTRFYPALKRHRDELLSKFSRPDAQKKWRHIDPCDFSYWTANLHLEPRDRLQWWQTWTEYFEFITRNQWFSRAWTIQETLLANRSVFFCGSVLFPISMVISLLEELDTCWYPHFRNRGMRCSTASRFLTLIGMRRNNQRIDPNPFAMEAVFEYFGRLLWLARWRKSKYKVDRVYSILAIASKILLPGSPVSFAVNLRSSPEDVYTWITKLFLQNSPSLYILSAVEDKASRTMDSMPSWVPDGTISLVWDDFEISDLLDLTARFISSMKQNYYPTTEDRIDALWKTLVFNRDESGDTLPDNMYYGFTEVLAAIHRWQQEHGEVMEDKRGKYATIANFANFIGKDKKFDLIINARGTLQLAPSETSEEYQGYVRRLLQAIELLRGFTVFRTSNGYIGRCPPSCRAGDTVFLLEGGTMPFVLRKDGAELEYTLMGECYVHGAMQGELMSSERCIMNTVMQTIIDEDSFEVTDGETWLVPLEEVDGILRPICGIFWEEITII